MRRRTVLAALGASVVSLAGCAGQGSPQNDSAGNDTPDTGSESPTPSLEAEVDIPTCPEKRESFTRETALAFAIQFEKAYATRRTLRDTGDRVVSIDVDIGDALTERDATQTDDGWLVRFTVNGPAYRYRLPNSTETAHVDPSIYATNYHITDQTVRRAQAVEAVDPRENGTVVHCPPE